MITFLYWFCFFYVGYHLLKLFLSACEWAMGRSSKNWFRRDHDDYRYL